MNLSVTDEGSVSANSSGNTVTSLGSPAARILIVDDDAEPRSRLPGQLISRKSFPGRVCRDVAAASLSVA